MGDSKRHSGQGRKPIHRCQCNYAYFKTRTLLRQFFFFFMLLCIPSFSNWVSDTDLTLISGSQLGVGRELSAWLTWNRTDRLDQIYTPPWLHLCSHIFTVPASGAKCDVDSETRITVLHTSTIQMVASVLSVSFNCELASSSCLTSS